MAKRAQTTGAVTAPTRGGLRGRIDAGLRSLFLLDRSAAVRRLADLAIRGMEIETVPSCLGVGRTVILVSNYPTMDQTLRALIKTACRFPGRGFRLKGIGRTDVVRNAGATLKALGIGDLLFPVYADDAGAYKLHKSVVKEVLDYLAGEGNILWMSITGRTRGNGLLETDVRTGAALLSTRRGVPLVPMGLVTRQIRDKARVVRVRFGEAVRPPRMDGVGEFERTDLLLDLSRLVLCRVAGLLPPGQRGDFESAEEMQEELESRLGMLQDQ
jgi:hypothetical protein